MACDWWTGDPVANSVQQLMFALCSVASLLSSTFLIRRLMKFKDRMNKIIVQQLLALAVADSLLAAWTSWTDVGQLFGAPEVQWCGWYTGILRFLQMVSMLLSLSLALGLITAVLRVKSVQKLLWAMPALSIPLSVILNLGYFIHPSQFHKNQFAVSGCKSEKGTGVAFGIEVIIMFFLELIFACLCFCQLRRSAPNSVLRRSIKTTSHYLLAFFLSYGFYALSKLDDILRDADESTCFDYTMHLLRTMLYSLNGLFNFWAFRCHVNRAAARVVGVDGPILHSHTPRNDLNVCFRAEQSMEEVFEFKPHTRTISSDQSEQGESSSI